MRKCKIFFVSSGLLVTFLYIVITGLEHLTFIGLGFILNIITSNLTEVERNEKMATKFNSIHRYLSPTADQDLKKIFNRIKEVEV